MIKSVEGVLLDCSLEGSIAQSAGTVEYTDCITAEG